MRGGYLVEGEKVKGMTGLNRGQRHEALEGHSKLICMAHQTYVAIVRQSSERRAYTKLT